MGVAEIDRVSPGSPDANRDLRHQEALQVPDAYLRYQLDVLSKLAITGQ